MNRYLKKVAVLMTVIMVVLMFAACGSVKELGNETTTAADNPTNASQKQTENKPVVIKFFTDLNETEGVGTGDTAFFEACEKANNIKMEFEEPPISNYSEKLQLMLASNELADVIIFPSTEDTSFRNAVTSDLLIPVNNYIKNAANIMKYSYHVSWEALKIMEDDNIYGIPRSSIIRYDGYWIREDWLKNVGLEIPKDYAVTIEEFEEICKRFTLNDPDKNGKNDTFGITAIVDSNKVFSPILPSAFGMIGWQKYDTEEYPYMDMLYSKKSPNYKNALSYTAKLYKSTYMSPSGLTSTSGSDYLGEFYKGLTGMVPAFSGYYYVLGETNVKKVCPDAKVSNIFIKNQNGEVKGVGFGTGMAGFWGIAKSCKAPDKVVQVFDWMLGDEGNNLMINGFEGIDYTLKDGAKVYNKEKAYSRRTNFMRRSGTITSVLGGPQERVMPQEKIDEFNTITSIGIGGALYSQSAGYSPAASQDVNFISYQKTYEEIVTKICLGELPVDEFDKALADWYKNGGEDYIKQMNEHIKKIKGE